MLSKNIIVSLDILKIMPIYEFDYLYIIENDIVGLGDDMTEILESTGDVVTNK